MNQAFHTTTFRSVILHAACCCCCCRIVFTLYFFFYCFCFFLWISWRLFLIAPNGFILNLIIILLGVMASLTDIESQIEEIKHLTLKGDQPGHVVSMLSMVEEEMRQQFQRKISEAESLFDSVNNAFYKSALLLPNHILQTKVKDFDGEINFFDNIIDKDEPDDIPVSYVSVQINPKSDPKTNNNTVNLSTTREAMSVLKSNNRSKINNLTNISIAQRKLALFSASKQRLYDSGSKSNFNGTVDSGNGSTIDSTVKTKLFSNSAKKTNNNTSAKKGKNRNDSQLDMPPPPNPGKLGLEVTLNIKNKPVRLLRKEDRARVLFVSTNGSPLVLDASVHNCLQQQTDKLISKLK